MKVGLWNNIVEGKKPIRRVENLAEALTEFSLGARTRTISEFYFRSQ